MTRIRTVLLAGVTTFGMFASVTVRADTYSTRTYNGGDSRGYTGDGDWDTGQWKGECAVNDRVVGISGTSNSPTTNGAFGQTLLCASGTVKVDGTSFSTRSLVNGSDDRADTGTSNWDVGLIKAECGTHETVGGVSQSSLGTTGLVHHILCRPITCNNTNFTINEASCNTVMYSLPDNRLSTADGDWSPGYMKNQCGPSQLLKGVSVNTNGTIHALLCCGYTTNSCIP